MNFNVSVFKCHSSNEIREAIKKALQDRINFFPESKDATILLKPNLNSDMNALTGNTTDLRIIIEVIKFLKSNGYRNVVIGEGTSSGFYHNQINVISRLKIDQIAQRFGVKVVDFNYTAYKEITLARGRKAKVAKICFDADFFINLPKIKMHFEVQMSSALKNMIGCLVGLEKQKAHDDLARNILKLNEHINPDFHIVDGLIAMEGTGPSKGTPIPMNLLLVGSDPFLVDLACARLVGLDYKEIPYLRLAEDIGRITPEHHQYLENLNLTPLQKRLKRPKVNFLTAFVNHPKYRKYFTALRLAPGFDYIFSTQPASKILVALGLRQDIFVKDDHIITKLWVDNERCNKCRVCAEFCPVGLDLPEQLSNKNKDCINCLYCYFVCPKEAVVFEGEPGFLSVQIKKYDDIIRDMVEKNFERQ